jgi:hypothetical protein
MTHGHFLHSLLIFCLFPLTCAVAQNAQNDRAYTSAVSVQPLYLFNRGLRIDYEKQLGNPYHWVQVSAKGYYMTDDGYAGLTTLIFDNDRIEDLSGVGTELNYKYFFLKKRIPYIAAGLSYHYFHTHQYGYDFIDFRQDDLTMYYPVYSLQAQDFNKVGFNTCFGVQTSPYKRFFVDGYIGIGYCRSFFDENRYYPDSDNMNGPSYTGFTLTTGIRLGIRF